MCEFRKGAHRPSEDWVEREILIALGGIAAEAIHSARTPGTRPSAICSTFAV